MLNAFDFSAIEEMDPSLGKFYNNLKDWFFKNKPNVLFNVRQYDNNSWKLFINFIKSFEKRIIKVCPDISDELFILFVLLTLIP